MLQPPTDSGRLQEACCNLPLSVMVHRPQRDMVKKKQKKERMHFCEIRTARSVRVASPTRKSHYTESSFQMSLTYVEAVSTA